jgi:hypothetical protein
MNENRSAIWQIADRFTKSVYKGEVSIMNPLSEPSTPKFCAKCGNSLRAGAKFCAGCGAPVVAKSPPSSAATPPQPLAPPPYTPPSQAGVSDATEPFSSGQEPYIPPASSSSPPPYTPPSPGSASDPTERFPLGQQPYTPPNQFKASMPPPDQSAYYQQPGKQAVPFSSGVSRVNLSQAWQFPFASSNWLATMLIGGLIVFVPIIGFFAVYGYMVEIIRRVANDDYDVLPGWDDFGIKLKDGLAIFGLMVIWGFLPVLLLSAPGFLIVSTGDEEIGSIVLSIGSLLGSFITYFFLPIVWGRYAVSNQFMSGLQIAQILEQARTNFGRYVGNWLLTGLMLFISIIAILIFSSITSAMMIFLVGFCFVPFIFMFSFYITLVQSHLMGQLYRTIM